MHEIASAIEYYLALLVWSKTKDAKSGANRPTRRARPEGDRKPVMALESDEGGPIHVIGGTGVSREEMAARLGWAPPPLDAPS